MLSKNINRIMIAGTGSGCGKTTITCAILKAFMNRGLATASFKCGPDYIDPMFHSEIIQAKSRNLDSFLCGIETTKYLFAQNAENVEISVVEGVMGFYDGLTLDSIAHSSCDLSMQTETPVVLVVDCSGLYYSIVAHLKGYLEFHPHRIVGVILNNTTKQMFHRYKVCIEKHLSIHVVGYMPHLPKAALESRHLGLITAAEIETLGEKMTLLANTAEECIDLDQLLLWANHAPPLHYQEIPIQKQCNVRIAVAQDKAFCFYYEDNFTLLRQLGAELVPFSPLSDSALPENIDGILIGGGYPELYADVLSRNISMLQSLHYAHRQAMPIYAECGGFMYIGKSITVKEHCYPMVGILQSNALLTNSLQHFGYTRLVALEDNLLCHIGQEINAHEFHCASSDADGSSFMAIKTIGQTRNCIFSSSTLFAGYPHLHLWGNIAFAINFVRKCGDYIDAHP